MKSISRRTVLRGLGGFVVALPALEIMTRGRARAATAPKRYIVAYCGMSTGRRNSGSESTTHDLLVPDAVGPDYDLKRALAPLAEVKDEVTVVSNLKIPWEVNGVIPPGGYAAPFHYRTKKPLLSGYRSTGYAEVPEGPSSDWLVSQQIGNETKIRSLNYRVQVATYSGTNSQDTNLGIMSYEDDGSGIRKVQPKVSPKLAYQSLFEGFSPVDPAEKAEAEALLARRRSVLDLVGDETKRLSSMVGYADRLKLERHYDEIRALEMRLQSFEPGGACMVPEEPGDDPPISGTTVVDEQYQSDAGYSGEEERAALFVDLMATAMACDLSRVGTLMFTMEKSYLNAKPFTGHNDSLHGLTHFGTKQFDGVTPCEGLSDGVAWHVRHWAELVKKLRDTPDIDGGSVLDNTAMVLLFEGGHGGGPEESEPIVPHSTENMAALVAGGAGGLVRGQHVVADEHHPAQLLITLMNAVGVSTETLGEISGSIPQLTGS